jgi:hypothetical protein
VFEIYGVTHEKLDVKFKGEVTDVAEAIDFAGTPLAGIYRTITVKVSDVLENPTGNLKAGMIAHVAFSKDFPNVEEVKVGDLVEVYGAFKGIEDTIVKISLEKTEHYLRNLFLVKIKGLTLIPQETPNSCWAASSEMVIKFYGTYAINATISQIQISRELGNEKYYWDGMPAQEALPLIGAWEGAIERLGKLDFDRDVDLTFEEVVSDISNNRPIMALYATDLWIWKFKLPSWLLRKAYHVVVIAGYIDRPGTENDDVLIYDPWPPGQGSIVIISWQELKELLWSPVDAIRTKPKNEKHSVSVHYNETRSSGILEFTITSDAVLPWTAAIMKWNPSEGKWDVLDLNVGKKTLKFVINVETYGHGNYRVFTVSSWPEESDWIIRISQEATEHITLESGILVVLQEQKRKLYLHIYDSHGRHIGIRHETGQIQNEIPGAKYIELNENITIIVLPSEILEFRCIIDASYATSLKESYNLTIFTIKDNILKSQETVSKTITKGEKQAFTTKIVAGLEKISIEEYEEIPWLLYIILAGVAIVGIAISLFILRRRLGF